MSHTLCADGCLAAAEASVGEKGQLSGGTLKLADFQPGGDPPGGETCVIPPAN